MSMGFDEATSKRLETAYMAPEIVRRRQLARAELGASPGHRVLDVGCGPGFYVTELLEEVGPSGSVAGVDSSADMLAIARDRCEGKGSSDFHEADATHLPFDIEEFDRVISVQVLEYVGDVGVALGEMYRVLKPGGRVVVWDSDWSSVAWHSENPARMQAMLTAWGDHLVDPGLPRTLGAHLSRAGFAELHLTAHSFAATNVRSDGFVGALLPLITAFLRNHRAVKAPELDAWLQEQNELSESGAFFFALTQCCFSATKPRN